MVPMAVIDQIDPDRAEAARAWIACRELVLVATERRCRGLGSGAVEAAVDQAWLELYEPGEEPPDAETLRVRWQRRAYSRVLNGVRDRGRHPVHPAPIEELDDFVVLDGRGGALEAARSQARLEEILSQTAGEGRRWLEALLETPAAPPRVLAARLGWEVEKVRTVARRTRSGLREFVAARESGVICERRQAVLGAFAATQRAADPGGSVDAGVVRGLSAERYREVALHIAGCLDCERAWRRARSRARSGSRLVFFPVLLGKAGAAGGSLWASGRRLLVGLRVRVESGFGRASAGGAAGTAGTAGVLAGKGAVTICAGLVCATGLGASALVGLPVGALQRAHFHHGSIKRVAASHRSGARVASAGAGTTAAYVSSANSMSAATSTSRARSARHTGSIGSHPVKPGDLLARSSTTGSGVSAPARVPAKVASTSTGSQQSSSTSSRTTVSSGSGSPCVPGSLGC